MASNGVAGRNYLEHCCYYALTGVPGVAAEILFFFFADFMTSSDVGISLGRVNIARRKNTISIFLKKEHQNKMILETSDHPIRVLYLGKIINQQGVIFSPVACTAHRASFEIFKRRNSNYPTSPWAEPADRPCS